MKTLVSRFITDQSGATAIEYGLIVTGIAIAILTVINNIGSGISSNLSTVSTTLK